MSATPEPNERADPRCPVCCNATWHARPPGCRTCTHCGLVAGAADLGRIGAEIAAWLAAGAPDAGARDWSLPEGALRNAAWAHGHVLLDGRVLPAEPAPHDVALGVIARDRDAARLVRLLDAAGAQFARVFVVFDGPVPPRLPARHARVASACHALEDGFAAQRDRVQRMAATGWVLQLDTDERPSARLLASLGWLVRAAEADGLDSLGLPRRNLVGGRTAALYPDIQYRLNRASVRFAGRVHERPSVAFERSSLALAGAIEHRLTRARVAARTREYERLAPGAGRAADETLLLAPYRGRRPLSW